MPEISRRRMILNLAAGACSAAAGLAVMSASAGPGSVVIPSDENGASPNLVEKAQVVVVHPRRRRRRRWVCWRRRGRRVCGWR